MSLMSDIKSEVKSIFSTQWSTRDGTKVPDNDDLRLGNDAVRLTGTILYADLADSTGLVTGFRDYFAAEIFKSYLLCVCRLITHNGGAITAFDGDRVMGVFVGDTPNTAAARCALQINYAVRNVLNAAIKEQYPTTSYQIEQAVGIDTGPFFVARAGRRNANDLIWVGRAANYAAKLCALREGNYSSFITEEVYNKIQDTSKFGGEPRREMWEKVMWTDQGVAIYRSSWWWAPD